MKRAIVLLLDSFGVGAATDAAPDDRGADTFGHIVEKFPHIKIPHLKKLGIFHVAQMSTGKILPNAELTSTPDAMYGYAVEQSVGKDTPSGHWEIAGVPLKSTWGYFNGDPTFPPELIEKFIDAAKLPGVLGLKHASGTEIINEFGDEHCKTGKPIVYTSADSVFQIACHEKSFGLQRLYNCCEIARRLVDDYNIGRVIARPFIGDHGNYQRTANRRDLAVPPPSATLLEQLVEQGGHTIAIGKTADIFAHQGIRETIHAKDNMALFDATLTALDIEKNKSLIFTNFVDFDSKYGHRRDVEGYASALEAFDARLPELYAKLQDGDLVIITADHGCDPTFPGSDHTREHIPILAFGPKIAAKNIGERASFADIGQTIATHLMLEPLQQGSSFLYSKRLDFRYLERG